MLIEKKEEGFNREKITWKQEKEKDKQKVKETWKDFAEFTKIVLEEDNRAKRKETDKWDRLKFGIENKITRETRSDRNHITLSFYSLPVTSVTELCYVLPLF